MNEQRARIPQSYLDELRDKIVLSELIGKSITLQRSGQEFKGLCPFHKERTASFYVNDAKRFFHCFGCGAHGDGIGFLMRQSNLPFEDAVREAATFAGQPKISDAARFEQNLIAKTKEYAAKEQQRFELSEDQRSRQSRARTIWRHAKPFSGSHAETYLRSRGIRINKWPPCLRYVEQAWHGWEQTKHPALVAAIQDSHNQVTAIQTTFLKLDGTGKAGVTPPKPVMGPMADGAVRLGNPGKILGIAEGIETALSARQLYSLPVWATCGSARLGAVLIPPGVTEVIIFGDNGEHGHEAANKASEEYGRSGYAFRAVFPENGFKDFNDVLTNTQKAA